MDLRALRVGRDHDPPVVVDATRHGRQLGSTVAPRGHEHEVVAGTDERQELVATHAVGGGDVPRHVRDLPLGTGHGTWRGGGQTPRRSRTAAACRRATGTEDRSRSPITRCSVPPIWGTTSRTWRRLTRNDRWVRTNVDEKRSSRSAEGVARQEPVVGQGPCAAGGRDELELGVPPRRLGEGDPDLVDEHDAVAAVDGQPDAQPRAPLVGPGAVVRTRPRPVGLGVGDVGGRRGAGGRQGAGERSVDGAPEPVAVERLDEVVRRRRGRTPRPRGRGTRW